MLALRHQGKVSVCEWLVRSGALIDKLMTHEELQACWLKKGDTVMTANGKAIMHVRPIENSQAFYDRELSRCKEALEAREL